MIIMTTNLLYNSKLSLEPAQLNEQYLNEFRDAKFPTYKGSRSVFLHWSQYKTAMTQFFEWINKPLYSINKEDVESFLETFDNESTKKSKRKLIKVVLVFLIEENAEFFEQLTKEQVLWILQLKG